MKSKASEYLELGMWVKSKVNEYLELGMWVKSKASEYEEISKQIHIFAFYKDAFMRQGKRLMPIRGS